MEIFKLSATEMAQKLRAKDLSAMEIAQATLARIEAVEPQVDAYLTVTAEQALAAAAAVDAKIAAGDEIAPLAGIPVAIIYISDQNL